MRSKLAIIQSISPDFNGFCKQNVNEKTAEIIGAEKTYEGIFKVLTLSAKVRKSKYSG